MKEKLRELQSDVPTFKLGGFAAKLIILAILAGIVWVARPLFHGLAFGLLHSPAVIIAFGVPMVVGLILFLYPPFEGKVTVFGVIFGICLLVGVLYTPVAGLLSSTTMASQTMDGSSDINEMPQVNPDNPRVIPKAVADTQTAGSVSYQQYDLGESDIARTSDGSIAWSYPVEPDNTRNSIYEDQRGVVMYDMTSIDNRTMHSHDDAQYKHGEGEFFDQSADWNIKKATFGDVAYQDDPIGIEHDGETYMYYIQTGAEWHLSPMPHTTPTWEGVTLLHEDGTIEDLSPEEAREHPVLDGQRIYPLSLTEDRIDSLEYRNGVWNQMVRHADQPMIADIPGDGNSQPFVIDLAGEEMTYVMVLEPHGEDRRGLYEVWFISAETGEYERHSVEGDNLMGPERSMDVVKSEDSQTGWGDSFKVVEPIPVVVEGDLWWHSKVTSTDDTDVSRNVFVNAASGEVVEVADDQAVRDFLAGENVEEVENVEQQSADGESNVSYYIVVYGEDGSEIDRIPVEGNQSTEIVSG